MKKEITGIDLENAMDIGAELQPIKEASLDEIKQHEKESPHAYAAPITTGDHNSETLKPELKTHILFQKEAVIEKTLTQTV